MHAWALDGFHTSPNGRDGGAEAPPSQLNVEQVSRLPHVQRDRFPKASAQAITPAKACSTLSFQTLEMVMKPLNTQNTRKEDCRYSVRCVLCIPWFKRGFSLIELMIVIIILGALTAIIIPMFSYTEHQAKEDAVAAEMARIRRAYIDFYNDNFPSDTELANLARYGLYPLVRTNSPSGYGGNWDEAVRGKYDPYNKLGWNGPYLMHEGPFVTVRVDAAMPMDQRGQREVSGGTQEAIPVVLDPYGGHYRVLASFADTNKLFLICTGIGRELDTMETDVDPTTGWIEAKGNDTALPLLPFN